MALWPRLPLWWRCKKRGSEICSQRLSITVHWGCVSEGRVNPDIFQEVKFLRKRMWRRRQKHGNSGTHPAALAAPSVNCCLETKQRSSLFSSLFSFWLENLQFSLWFAVKRISIKLLGWIGLLIFRYDSGHSYNRVLIVANTCHKNYCCWQKSFPYGRKERKGDKEKREIQVKKRGWLDVRIWDCPFLNSFFSASFHQITEKPHKSVNSHHCSFSIKLLLSVTHPLSYLHVILCFTFKKQVVNFVSISNLRSRQDSQPGDV